MVGMLNLFEEYAIAIDAQMKYSKRKGKLNKQVF